MTILLEIDQWTRKNLLNFRSRPRIDQNLETLKTILRNCEIGHFPHFGSCLCKKKLISIKDVTLDKEVLVKFCKSSRS